MPARPTEPATRSEVPIVENMGQWPARVRFAVGPLAQGPWIEDGALGLWVDAGGGAVRIELVGVEPAGGWSPAHRRAEPVVSYFVGDDPSRHRAGVPVWGEVRRRLADGSELVIASGGPRGWRWRIDGPGGAAGEGRSGGQSTALRLRVEGALGLRGGPDGAMIATPSGPIALPPLEVGSGAGRATIERAEGGGEIELAATVELEVASAAVDSGLGPRWASVEEIATSAGESRIAPASSAAPGLDWATYLGGSGDEKLFALDVDFDGSVYVAGSATSSDLPITPGAFDGRMRGGRMALVARLSADGARMESLTLVGGSGLDYVKAIELDRETGELVVGGDTTSTDFPTTADAHMPVAPARWNAFLVRLSADGTALRYGSYFGGASEDYVEDLHVGQGGSVTLLIETWSADLETSPAAALPTYRGGSDAYVVRFDAESKRPAVASYIGGAGADCHDCSLAVGTDDTIFVAGWTNSDDLPISSGAISETRRGVDGYVVALDRTGERFRYGTYLGGRGSECTVDCEIVVGPSGHVVIVGSTDSPDFPTTPGAFVRRGSGGSDVFLASIAPDGTSLGFSAVFGGGGNDVGHRVVPRADGIWVMGASSSFDFPTTPDALFSRPAGADDLFLALFSRDAGRLVYSTLLGGRFAECEFNCGMVVHDGAFVVGATTASTDVPVTSGAFSERSAGRTDGYVARLVPGEASVPPTATPTATSTPECPPGHVCFTVTPTAPAESATPATATPTGSTTPTSTEEIPGSATPTATATATSTETPTATGMPTATGSPPPTSVTPTDAPEPVAGRVFLPFAVVAR